MEYRQGEKTIEVSPGKQSMGYFGIRRTERLEVENKSLKIID